jgi:20S proteasome alpha/beta subunit
MFSAMAAERAKKRRKLVLTHDYILDACSSPGEEYPEPKLSDWRFGVTSCIAAITQREYIVTTSDTRLSFSGDYSTDGVIKDEGLHREWALMIAGSDMAQAQPVIDAAKRLLRKQSGEMRVVRDACRQAYQAHRREVMTDKFLSTFDMTIEEFKRNGPRQLLPEVFADISIQMRSFNLGCTFMVYGFDDSGHAHIFTVTNPGRSETYDRPGFWAIGAGKYSALSTLSVLKQNISRSSLPETIYNVLAAKYTSETASDVGPETWLWIKKIGCDAFSYDMQLEPEIRKLWQDHGRPKTLQAAGDVFNKSKVTFLTAARLKGKR